MIRMSLKSKAVFGITASMNRGIMNKGNACYINASLQSFRSMVESWSNFSLRTDTLCPFVSFFIRTISMLRSRKAALDPPSFYVACRTSYLSWENKVLICLSSRMLMSLCLLYLKSYVGSYLMHRNCLQPLLHITLL